MNYIAEQAATFVSWAKNLIFVSGFSPMDETEYASLSREELTLSFYRVPLVPLFHYYPDVEDPENKVNYSRKALVDGTIHLSDPKAFNDPFECALSVDKDALMLEAIRGCARRIGAEGVDSDDVRIAAEQLASSRCAPGECVLNQGPERTDEFERLPVELFKLTAQVDANSRGVPIDAEAVLAGARAVVDHTVSLWGHFKAFCFTTTYLNPAMWAYYASGHRGFCVEYDRSNISVSTFPSLDADLKHLLAGVYPVAYGLRRPDCTRILAECLYGKDRDETLDEIIKNCICRKALHWGIEEEWRLVMYDRDPALDKNDTVRFLRPKAVYAGALMDRKKDLPDLARICADKGIDLYVMTPDEHTYELHPEHY